LGLRVGERGRAKGMALKAKELLIVKERHNIQYNKINNKY
jgi:hypothetical protein